ncbi:MAG TPA: hypothetical protein DCX17_02520, partial [Firmicutes bacterium]|nr:hypothetical protein [Bacillota bacterium]
MEQYFLFKAGRSIPNNTFKELVNETYRERFELKFNDHLSGYIVADSRFYDALSLLLPVVN